MTSSSPTGESGSIDAVIDRFIGGMARRLSSLEVLLSAVASLLLLCCVALVVMSSLSLKPPGDPLVPDQPIGRPSVPLLIGVL